MTKCEVCNYNDNGTGDSAHHCYQAAPAMPSPPSASAEQDQAPTNGLVSPPFAAPAGQRDAGNAALLRLADSFDMLFNLNDKLEVSYVSDSLRFAAGAQPLHEIGTLAVDQAALPVPRMGGNTSPESSGLATVATAGVQEPVYQVKQIGATYWWDVSKTEFDSSGSAKRILFTAPTPAPSGPQDIDAANEVIVDRRDLFDFLRMAWRDGSGFGWTDTAEGWSKATDYVNKIIREWGTLRAALAAKAPQPSEVATPEDFKLVPIERSYDERVKQIIAFNQCGGDLDDKLEAAHKALPVAQQSPTKGEGQ